MRQNTGPSNLEHPDMERALLASILFDGNCIVDVVGKIRADDFSIGGHKQIYWVMQELFNKNHPINAITVSDALVSTRHIPDPKEIVREIGAEGCTAANNPHYVTKISEASRLRNLEAACNKSAAEIRDGPPDAGLIIDRCQERIHKAADGNRDDGGGLMSGDAEECLAASRQVQESGGLGGLSTGFKSLDWWAGGFQKGQVVILAALTGQGKTSLAMNIAANVAKGDQGLVVVFSLEMGRLELVRRIVAADCGIPERKLAGGQLRDDEWDLYENSVERTQDLREQIYLRAAGLITPETIRADLRRLSRTSNVALVVVDYIQLLGTTQKAETRNLQVQQISRQLKSIAMDFDVPVLALSQFSRDAARRNSPPRLEDLRDSGSLEQDAGLVLFLHSLAKDKSEPQTIQLIVAKNRSGPVGKMDLYWNPTCVRFSEIEKRVTGIHDHEHAPEPRTLSMAR